MEAAPRIVSLIASATEIVCALGLRDRLVGVSHECDFPPGVDALPVLSRAKIDPTRSSGDIDRSVREIVRDGLSVYEVLTDRLEEAAPDVIVTQQQCEVCAVSLSDVQRACAQIAGSDAKICSLEPETLDDIRADFRRVAKSAGCEAAGDELVRDFDARLASVSDRVRGAEKPSVALVEWLDPPMIAGGWMPELAAIAGARPVIVTEPRHFDEVTWPDVERADPDVVVILPCGFSIERSIAEIDASPATKTALRDLRATRQGRCYVADGNAFFNRPGPRIADSAHILASICHPDRFDEALSVVQWS